MKKGLKIAIVLVILLVVILAVVYIKISRDRKEYTIEKIEKYSYFKVYQGGKYGVIDTEGNVLVSPSFDAVNIPNPTKDVFVCYSNYNETTGKYETKVVNKENKEIFTKFDEVLPLLCEQSTSNIPFEKTVLQYKENDKYGIIDFSGNKITDAIYDELSSLEYREGSLKVKQNDKYGVINIKGYTIVKSQYDDIKADEYYTDENEYLNSGFIVQLRTDDGYRYGYVNQYGRELIKPDYNEIERITEMEDTQSYLLVSKNGKYGILKNSQTIVECSYEEIEYNKTNNLFIVQKNSKQGVVSIDGKEILPVEFDYILPSNNKLTTRKGDGIEVYNANGERQDIEYENYVETANENYIIVIDQDNKYGVINKNKQVLLKNDYDNLEYAFNDYFIATQNRKVGVVDINKGTVVEFEYDIIQRVKGKNILQAIISETDTIEVYNSNMEKQTSMKTAILYIFDNYIKLISGDYMEYLDNDGNIISNKDIFTDNKLLAYNDNGKWGFKNQNDEIVIKPEYDLVTELNQYGYAGIKKDGKWGVINEDGQIIVSPIYKIDWNEPDFINKYCKLNFGYGFEYYTDEIKN